MNPDIPLAREIQATLLIDKRNKRLEEIDRRLASKEKIGPAELAELRRLRARVASFPESLNLDSLDTVEAIRKAWPKELD